ncbi:MAG: ExbD/TolR family protein [Nevskiaceae bacterium]
MKMSKRGLRKVRRARKQSIVASINLVSMIDIFVILVIYLLVNTAAVQIVGAELVELPKSVAVEPPRENVSVILTLDDVLVDGTPVMKVADIRPGGPAVIPALRAALQEASPPTPAQQDGEDGGEVNILADKAIPYSLLKRIMTTCADAQFARISLGVNPGPGQAP